MMEWELVDERCILNLLSRGTLEVDAAGKKSKCWTQLGDTGLRGLYGVPEPKEKPHDTRSALEPVSLSNMVRYKNPNTTDDHHESSFRYNFITLILRLFC